MTTDTLRRRLLSKGLCSFGPAVNRILSAGLHQNPVIQCAWMNGPVFTDHTAKVELYCHALGLSYVRDYTTVTLDKAALVRLKGIQKEHQERQREGSRTPSNMTRTEYREAVR